MKSSFTLPVVIAASSHALFLFGFNSSTRDLSATPPVEPDPVPYIQMFPMDLIEPEEPEIVDANDFESESTNTSSDSSELAPTVADSTSLPPLAQPDRIHTEISVFTQKPQPPTSGHSEGWLRGGAQIVSFPASGLDNEPTATFRMSPRYPDAMRRAGVEETVMVTFVVGREGRVMEAKAESTARREFAIAAERAVQRWTFKPGKRHGKIVAFRMSIPIVFSLSD